MAEEIISSRTEPMRRPLLGIAFCYLAGTFVGAWINGLHFITVLLCALSALIIAFGLQCIPPRRRMTFLSPVLPGLAAGFIYLAIFLSGCLAINLRLNSPSARDISALLDRPREGVGIIGVVADDPARRKNRRGDFQYWSFTMKVEALSRTGSFQKARGKVLVNLPANASPHSPHYGERWQLAGALIDKMRLANASGMDAIKYRLPCRFVLQCSEQSSPGLMAESSPWDLFYWCFILRQKCADTLARGLAHRPDEAGILQALLLGRRYELPEALRQAFVATGTYHIFAVSGQHVAIIAMFVVIVLQAYGIGRLHWFYFLAPLLIVFTVMAGLSASAVRGCIMALMCFLGPVCKRKTDIPSAMALAALLIVGADPLQLFQAGFLLSFGIVAGLIVLCPPLIAVVESKIAADPYQLEPEKWPARVLRNMLRWILFLIAASFAAWLVSTPLIARWFNLVSPVALPANLIVIPMATLILFTGCLSIVSGFLCPLIAEAFNFANAAFVALTTGATKTLAQVPFGHVFIRSPPIWFIGLWLGVLVVWRIYHAKSVIYYQKTRIGLAAVLLLLIAGVMLWRLSRNEWEIHVLNIDQCAVCLVNKAGNPILLNTGPRYQAGRVLRYLRAMGVNRIQAFVGQFPDSKHVGGAKDIISALPASEIWCGPQKPGARFLNELGPEIKKWRIKTRVLTNEVTPAGGQVTPASVQAAPVGGQAWRITSNKNGWNIDAFDTAQSQNENSQLSHSDGQMTIFVNTGRPTQMTARIFIGNEQLPLAIDIEETPVSGFRNNARASLQADCRILCYPTVEERVQNYCDQASGCQLPAQIVLGPGQGIRILPDKKRKWKIEPIN